VTLRGKKVDEGALPTVSFRCPPDLRRYINDTAKSTRRDKTEIITDALALDRDLAVSLKPSLSRIEAFADGLGLDMDKGLAEVLSRLILAGLDAVGHRK
jgi:predicted transcriptional regulator